MSQERHVTRLTPNLRSIAVHPILFIQNDSKSLPKYYGKFSWPLCVHRSVGILMIRTIYVQDISRSLNPMRRFQFLPTPTSEGVCIYFFLSCVRTVFMSLPVSSVSWFYRCEVSHPYRSTTVIWRDPCFSPCRPWIRLANVLPLIHQRQCACN